MLVEWTLCQLLGCGSFAWRDRQVVAAVAAEELRPFDELHKGTEVVAQEASYFGPARRMAGVGRGWRSKSLRPMF